MIIVTTLVIPPGGDAGPFDLYSDSDGYTVPFATNVSAAALQAGYSSTVPNDATIIRVISTGLCTNFIDLNINLITTTTTSSSSTSTSTSTSTSSTSTSSTSTSSSSTTTSTSTSTSTSSSTTTTTTTCPCYIYNFVAGPIDAAEGGVNLQYTACSGALRIRRQLTAGTFSVCIGSNTLYDITKIEGGTVDDSTLTITSECCTQLPYTCQTYQINPPVDFRDPSHVVEYIDCVSNIPFTVSLVYGDGPVPICESSIVSDSNSLLTTGPLGSCPPTTTTTSTTSSARTLIGLYQNGSEANACNTAGSIANVYMNTSSFITCTILYAGPVGGTTAFDGWYTDGSIYRYWDGSNFGIGGTCL